MKKLILILLLIITSCTDSGRAKVFGYGSEYKITLYDYQGAEIESWISSGKVKSEDGSDGYYFLDKKTDKLIEVTGILVIKEL